MRIFTILFLILFFSKNISAQVAKNEIEGVVTYQTAQNIYLKFNSAKGIKPGDKIYTRKNNSLVSVMLVENVSSISCVGKSTGEEKLKTGDKVIALVSRADAVEENSVQQEQKVKAVADSSGTTGNSLKNIVPLRKERIDGRIQVSSYTNMSNLASGNNTRLRYIFSLNASNVSNSRISLDSYVSFSHRLDDWASIRENVYSGLKIYDLNLKYEAGENSTIWLGRKINSKISSLGAIDGMQYEMNLKHFYWGAVAGFRPDYTNYSFNKNLLEYGAFIGHVLKNTNGIMQTSLAGFNQTNAGNTDRRFLYFQHDNSILKNLNLFVSSEIDLYKMLDGVPVNEPSLTSLYMLLNYRISGKMSISGSYDNRRNIIYYETFKNYIDVMLEDATRQGVMLRINYRPVTYLSTGISSSYWDRQGDSKPTKNVNGYLTYSRLPWLDASASLTVNALQTSYVEGKIYGLRFDKGFVNGKLNWSLNYRYVDYTYVTSQAKLLEHIAGTDLSVQFTRKFSFSVSYEGTFEKENKYHQVYGSLIKRF
jgi:hypothetical protein